MKWLDLLADAKLVAQEAEDLREALPSLRKVEEALRKCPEWASVEKEWGEFVEALRRLADDF